MKFLDVSIIRKWCDVKTGDINAHVSQALVITVTWALVNVNCGDRSKVAPIMMSKVGFVLAAIYNVIHCFFFHINTSIRVLLNVFQARLWNRSRLATYLRNVYCSSVPVKTRKKCVTSITVHLWEKCVTSITVHLWEMCVTSITVHLWKFKVCHRIYLSCFNNVAADRIKLATIHVSQRCIRRMLSMLSIVAQRRELRRLCIRCRGTWSFKNKL